MRQSVCTQLVLAFGLLPVGAAASAISIVTEASIADLAPAIVAAGAIEDPLYSTLPSANGIARLLLSRRVAPSTYTTSLCTGAVIDGGSTILTAAHCVTDDAGDLILASGTAQVASNGTTETRSILGVSVNPFWNGNVLQGGDLAVIRLSAALTNSVSYGLYTSSDENFMNYSVFGFGRRGSSGAGVTGSSPLGAARMGQNRFEVNANQLVIDSNGTRLGNSDVLLADFDDGTAAHDAFGFYFGLTDGGLGVNEVGTAAGDSGGPALIGNQIAGVTSFGFRFGGSPNSDIDGLLNSSYGEFDGFARVSSHDEWILGQHSFHLVPEPGTWGLAALGIAALLIRRGTIS